MPRPIPPLKKTPELRNKIYETVCGEDHDWVESFVVRRYGFFIQNKPEQLDELLQVARLAFLEAIDAWEPKSGEPLPEGLTPEYLANEGLFIYAQNHIRARCMQAIYDEFSAPVKLPDRAVKDGERVEVWFTGGDTPGAWEDARDIESSREQLNRRDNRIALEAAISRLRPRDQFIILSRLAGHTLDEIAETVDVSRQRINQIELEVIEKLKKWI